MNFFKMGFALSLVATFGIVACEDSTSAEESNDPNTISCKVSQEMTETDPLIFKTVKGDLSSTTTFKNDNGIAVMTAEFNQDVPENECLEYKDVYGDHLKVECKGNTITAKSEEKLNDTFFDIFSETLKGECSSINGKKLDPKDVEKAKEEAIEGAKCSNDGDEKKVSKEVTTDDGKTASAEVILVCKDGKWTPKDAKVNTSSGDETATDDEDDVEADTNTGDEGASDEGEGTEE